MRRDDPKSAEFNIAASTAQRSLAHLRTTGVVRTEPGLGTFVAGEPDDRVIGRFRGGLTTKIHPVWDSR